jgi:excisionase family DNA binding protein
MPQRKNPLAQSTARPPFVIVPQLMNGREAAVYLGENYYDLMRRSAAGEIPRVKWGASGRNVRFRKADLDRWVASLPLAEGAVRPKPARRESEPVAS